MKQVTAVEWLILELKKSLPSVYNGEFNQEIEQAKEMEKQNLCDFGAKCCIMTTQKRPWLIEELYEETFNK